jgi:UDP-N-acetylglucosamine--N-acetylmuramyl-(pentapeptide) pyrophosphoryl-undecaprenol N-acetylglucosamine transferase
LAKRLRLKRKDSEIIFFVPKDRLTQLILTEFKVRYSSIGGFRISSMFGLIKCFFESLLFLKDFKPDIVIGFGGAGSLPLILEAKILGIRTLIHEQNVIPGRTNRFLSFFVDRICVSFPETKDYFLRVNKRKVIFTGNPLREEIGTKSKIESLRYFDLDFDRFTLLIMGGSQGSSKINSIFLETLLYFQNNDLQVIHITGFRDYRYVRNFYEKIRFKNSRVFDFLERADYAYGAADLVICRSGATTISEITKCKLPSILIPYPYAYGHQKENALTLARKGAAILIEDKDLSPSYLRDIILDLKNDRGRLKEMSSKFEELRIPDATQRLSEEVLSLLS